MSAAIVVARESPLIDAVHVMADEGTSALPVVAEGRLVGLLTDRDIVVRGVAAGIDLQAACVGDVASSGLVYVRPEQPVGHALLLMAAHQLRRIPVVDDSLRVVGTITQVDIARSPAARRRAPAAAGLKPARHLPISRGDDERPQRRR